MIDKLKEQFKSLFASDKQAKVLIIVLVVVAVIALNS